MTVQLSPLTLERLKTHIIGDDGPFPRLKGEQIIKLFNQVGIKDVYDWENNGMPDGLSRKNYTSKRLKELNGKKEMQVLLESIVSKAHFLQSPHDRTKAIETINTILSEDNYNLIDVGDNVYKIGGAIVDDAAIVEAHFEENQKIIIEEIRKARFLIWVAVAWLTDTTLLTELRKKQQDGLNVQIVTQDDEINAKLKLSVQKVFNSYYKPPRGTYKNLMHHKFCIIDLRTVVHGSYNWP